MTTEINRVIIAIINMYQNGVQLFKLDLEYKKREGYQIPYGYFGYSTLLKFLENEIPDNIKIVKEGINTWIIPVSNTSSGHVLKLIQDSKNSTARKPMLMSSENHAQIRSNFNRVEKNLSDWQSQFLSQTEAAQAIAKQRLIQDYELKLDRIYKKSQQTRQQCQTNNINKPQQKNHAITSDIQKLDDVEEGAKSESGVIKTKTLQTKHSVDGDVNVSFSTTSNTSNPADVPKSSIPKPRQFLPSNVVDNHMEITEIKECLEQLHVGVELNVLVSNVSTPLKFWVHIRNDRHDKQMKILRKEMNAFFHSHHHCEDLKVFDPRQPGLKYFTTRRKRQWCRIQLHDLYIGESVRVHFIDYGVCDIINISQMRLLPKQFWTVTKDVVCCALANIQSIGKVFSPQSTDDFWNMVEGESLIATISKLDMKKSRIHLILKTNKICVNDELVRLGHANANKE